jgi:1-deoxy-D-xylulose-5-phosphate reductoisomerase
MKGSKGIAVLGSTGSIGRNTLDVVRHLDGSHRIVALAAARNGDALMEQIREFRPAIASLSDAAAAGAIREAAGRLGTEVLGGSEGTSAVATAPGAELVVSAIVGSAGLVPTHAAVASGRTVALANKEVLVVGGAAIRSAARRAGAELLPVDSEHNALHQCLRAGRPAEVRRLILTASGGPFWERRDRPFEEITVAEALAHPVWDMGPKITIDSATMMNKGLEVIEARWLFDLPGERIDILVHPGSVVHSLVEYADGSILAQLGVADMRQPIQYALTWPERRPTPVAPLDLAELPALRFFRPDPARFPCPSLAYRALELGGVATAALNGANEALVEAFLDGEIGFMDLPRRLGRVLDDVERGAAPGGRAGTPDLKTCLAADAWARERALAPLPAVEAISGGTTA